MSNKIKKNKIDNFTYEYEADLLWPIEVGGENQNVKVVMAYPLISYLPDDFLTKVSGKSLTDRYTLELMDLFITKFVIGKEIIEPGTSKFKEILDNMIQPQIDICSEIFAEMFTNLQAQDFGYVLANDGLPVAVKCQLPIPINFKLSGGEGEHKTTIKSITFRSPKRKEIQQKKTLEDIADWYMSLAETVQATNGKPQKEDIAVLGSNLDFANFWAINASCNKLAEESALFRPKTR